jgi:hypothetical protein
MNLLLNVLYYYGVLPQHSITPKPTLLVARGECAEHVSAACCVCNAAALLQQQSPGLPGTAVSDSTCRAQVTTVINTAEFGSNFAAVVASYSMQRLISLSHCAAMHCRCTRNIG